jgi:hypothetical protein
MAKYRKKPVEIEAFQFYIDKIPDWFMDAISKNKVKTYNCDYKKYTIDEAYCLIETLEGTMKANGGDFIIKGVKGEIYPCKPDIFEMTYVKENAMNLLHKLSIKNTKEKFELKLDDFEIKGITDYKITGTTNDFTRLKLELIVSEINT